MGKIYSVRVHNSILGAVVVSIRPHGKRRFPTVWDAPAHVREYLGLPLERTRMVPASLDGVRFSLEAYKECVYDLPGFRWFHKDGRGFFIYIHGEER